jgi:hypothetical protein
MFALPFSYGDNIFSYTADLETALDGDRSTASCFIRVYGDGSIELGTIDVDSNEELVPNVDFWIKPNNFNYVDNYEFFATVTGLQQGIFLGTTGSWISLSSSVSSFEWRLRATSNGDTDARADVTVQIRRKGSTIIIGTIVADMRMRD